MIFCNFMQGPKFEPTSFVQDELGGFIGAEEELELNTPGGAYNQVGSTITRNESTVERLRRLVRASSSKLMGSSNRIGNGLASHQTATLAKTASGSELAAMRSIESSITGDNLNNKVDKTNNLVNDSNSNNNVNEKIKKKKNNNNTNDWQLDCKYTLSEVQQHSTLDDCWMVIFDKVYDVTDFVDAHPGGDFILLEYAGRDATHGFLSTRHGSTAYKMMDKYWIGILVDEELCYSNNSSYCSVYSNLSWRRTPPLSDSSSSSSSSSSSPEESNNNNNNNNNKSADKMSSAIDRRSTTSSNDNKMTSSDLNVTSISGASSENNYSILSSNSSSINGVDSLIQEEEEERAAIELATSRLTINEDETISVDTMRDGTDNATTRNSTTPIIITANKREAQQSRLIDQSTSRFTNTRSTPATTTTTTTSTLRQRRLTIINEVTSLNQMSKMSSLETQTQTKTQNQTQTEATGDNVRWTQKQEQQQQIEATSSSTTTTTTTTTTSSSSSSSSLDCRSCSSPQCTR